MREKIREQGDERGKDEGEHEREEWMDKTGSRRGGGQRVYGGSKQVRKSK